VPAGPGVCVPLCLSTMFLCFCLCHAAAGATLRVVQCSGRYRKPVCLSTRRQEALQVPSGPAVCLSVCLSLCLPACVTRGDATGAGRPWCLCASLSVYDVALFLLVPVPRLRHCVALVPRTQSKLCRAQTPWPDSAEASPCSIYARMSSLGLAGPVGVWVWGGPPRLAFTGAVRPWVFDERPVRAEVGDGVQPRCGRWTVREERRRR
jgi:hypothetical protein